MEFMLFLNSPDPIQGATNIVYKLVGLGGALILLTIVFKGLGMLNKMAIQSLIGLVAVGLFLMLFTSGEESKNMLQDWADWLMKYARGE